MRPIEPDVGDAVERATQSSRTSRVGRMLQRARSLPFVSLLLLVVVVAGALLADFVAPHDPLKVDIANRLQPPVFQGGTWTHMLGTDGVGRDILSRILFGGRISLGIALTSLALGAAVGTSAGLAAGYVRGKTDAFVMRIADLTISFPMFLVALIMAITLGPSAFNIVIAVSVVLWARFARVVRGEVLSLRSRGYVALAQISGASSLRVIARHILPNISNTVIVLGSISLGGIILTEAALSFLGAGVSPPAPAWGSMIASGRGFVTTAWWVPTMPGLAIVAVVLAVNLGGDWLRDRLDPNLREL